AIRLRRRALRNALAISTGSWSEQANATAALRPSRNNSRAWGSYASDSRCQITVTPLSSSRRFFRLGIVWPAKEIVETLLTFAFVFLDDLGHSYGARDL